MLSVSKKSAYGVLFRALRRFPLAPMGLPGGKRRKETLHSKVSESAAHVAGFGLHLEGFSPPNLPEGFFDSLRILCLSAKGCFSFYIIYTWGRYRFLHGAAILLPVPRKT